MLIEAGFDIAFECPAPTPMILQLSIHPSRDADLLTPDRIASDPPLPMRSYLDLFGNRVTRVEVPAGLVTFSDRFVIQDSGEPDETPPAVGTTPIADLPDETLLFLVSSRYCDSDKLADFTWSQFGKLSGGAQCVQAICDFVHSKIRFSYAQNPLQLRGCALDPLRQRFHARRHRRLPGLRPSRHRALPLHEHPCPLLHRLSRRHRRSSRH
jgi:transglutaminase-like putative cysteine protease